MTAAARVGNRCPAAGFAVATYVPELLANECCNEAFQIAPIAFILNE